MTKDEIVRPRDFHSPLLRQIITSTHSCDVKIPLFDYDDTFFGNIKLTPKEIENGYVILGGNEVSESGDKPWSKEDYIHSLIAGINDEHELDLDEGEYEIQNYEYHEETSYESEF
jgi:hypothetical protein